MSLINNYSYISKVYNTLNDQAVLFLNFSLASLFKDNLFFLLSRFFSVFNFLRKVVLDKGLGLVGNACYFYLFYVFFLKKFTRKTLNKDYMKEAPLPLLVYAFNRSTIF